MAFWKTNRCRIMGLRDSNCKEIATSRISMLSRSRWELGANSSCVTAKAKCPSQNIHLRKQVYQFSILGFIVEPDIL
jgi:hypothetical protein